FSSSVMAYDIKALVIDPNNERTVGCFTQNTDSNGITKHTVVFRVYPGIRSFVIDEKSAGRVVVFEGTKAVNGSGIASSLLPFEALNRLPDYYNEPWTYPTPEFTIFAARGNYVGFFITQV